MPAGETAEEGRAGRGQAFLSHSGAQGGSPGVLLRLIPVPVLRARLRKVTRKPPDWGWARAVSRALCKSLTAPLLALVLGGGRCSAAHQESNLAEPPWLWVAWRGVAGFAACGTFRLLAGSFLLAAASGLQCCGCNVMVGSRSVNTGCSSPEVITCPRSHQGFKHRFCIKMESVVLGTLLTGGCAPCRHCQQQALPGTQIHCCNRDLCHGSPPRSSCPVCCFLIPGMVLATFLL